MSLSGQYLEELSRRYKKQVEELQLSFAKTLLNIEEQGRRDSEQKHDILEQNQMLRTEIQTLTKQIFSWKNILLGCICFTCVQLMIFHLILKIWGHRYGLRQSSSIDIRSAIDNMDAAPRKRKTGNVETKFRRKSAEEKRERTISESSALQRRPSTEALNITGTYTELLINGSNSNSTQNNSSNSDYKIKRDEKRSIKNGASSNDYIDSDYVRMEELKQMYDEPENEYEFYGPSIELKNQGFNSKNGDSVSTLDSSLENSSPQPKKSTKSIRNKNKNRRLSSPSFLKSPFSNGSPAQSTKWEWHKRKPLKSSQLMNKKAKSESPPTIKQNGLNGNTATTSSTIPKSNANANANAHVQQNTNSARSSISSTNEFERKPSGSFKRLLKKFF